MPVQMIELEEVTMVETTDEALEAAQGGVLMGRWTQYTFHCYCPYG